MFIIFLISILFSSSVLAFDGENINYETRGSLPNSAFKNDSGKIKEIPFAYSKNFNYIN